MVPFKVCPIQYVFLIFINIVDMALPFIIIYTFKIFLNMLEDYNVKNINEQMIISIILVYIILNIIMAQIQTLRSYLENYVREKMRIYLDKEFMKKMNELDLSVFDNVNFHYDIEAAIRSQYILISNSATTIKSVMFIFTFISAITMLLPYNAIIGLIFLATYIPGAIVSFINDKKMTSNVLQSIPETREKEYYREILTDKMYAKELRLYNLKDYFKDKYDILWEKIRNSRIAIFQEGIKKLMISSILTNIGFFLVICYGIFSVINRNMTIGDLSFYIGVSKKASQSFNTLIYLVFRNVKRDVDFVLRVKKFFDIKPLIENKGKLILESIENISFKNVTFKYPNCDDYVLSNINFTINKGEKIALLGLNGAGKSTIVKLLLRLYDVSKGKILINDIEISKYEVTSLRKLFGTCFQDVVGYAFTLAENIALSDISDITNEKLIESAAKKSGVDSLYKDWDNGLDTELTMAFSDDGKELSKGQWQKVALARAFFKKSEIILLDEPSSALDPEAEDHIFETFNLMAKNKCGIIISHRLSCTQIVDKIIVLENGCIAEFGTHNELIAKNGKYSELYNIQSQKYKAEV